MKYLTTTLVLITAMMQPAFAEGEQHGRYMDGEPHAEQHMNRLLKGLELSSEQEPQVKQILKEQHEKMRAEMQAIREQAKPRMEALHEETKQRLSTVLDDEQLQKFEHSAKTHHKKMVERKSRWKEKKNAPVEE